MRLQVVLLTISKWYNIIKIYLANTYIVHVVATVLRKIRRQIHARLSAALGWRPAPTDLPDSRVPEVFPSVFWMSRRPFVDLPFSPGVWSRIFNWFLKLLLIIQFLLLLFKYYNILQITAARTMPSYCMHRKQLDRPWTLRTIIILCVVHNSYCYHNDKGLRWRYLKHQSHDIFKL